MKAFALTAIALAGSGWGVAQVVSPLDTKIDQTIDAPRQGIVVVHVDAGRITIEGWNRSEVQVRGSISGAEEHLRVSTSRGKTEIRMTTPDNEVVGTANITVRVPEGSSLDIQTESADVAIDRVLGIVRMASLSGNLELAGKPTGILARSETGDIDVGPDVSRGSAYSEAGTVRLRGNADNVITRRDFRQTATSQDGRYRRLGDQISAIVNRVVRDVDVDGSVDINHSRGRLKFDVAGDLAYDREALEEMLETLHESMSNLEEDLADELAELSTELAGLGRELERELSGLSVSLSEELERAGRELRDEARRNRRGR